MKVPLGRKLWLHESRDPREVVISSHGCRDGNVLEQKNVTSYLPGTTVHFVVEDGDPAVFPIRQGLQGSMPKIATHTEKSNPLFYDYELSKFQADSHTKLGNRHNPAQNPAAIESYKDIQGLIDNRLEKQRTDWYASAFWYGQNKKNREQGFTAGIDDFVNRAVITIRSGGRYSKQVVMLSEVIKEAQAYNPAMLTFWCLFCRVIYH